MTITDKIVNLTKVAWGFVIKCGLDIVEIACDLNKWFNLTKEPMRFIIFCGIFVMPLYLALITKSSIIGTYVSILVTIRLVAVIKEQFFNYQKRTATPPEVKTKDMIKVVPDKVEPTKIVDVSKEPYNPESGFTLIELMIVLAIIGIGGYLVYTKCIYP